jgi:hypothetical protein
MIDGDVRGALVELSDRVAALLHDRFHQITGFGDGRVGLVDEPRLLIGPQLGEAERHLTSQRPDREPFHPGFALAEFGLGPAPIPLLVDETVVLRSEVAAKILRTLLSEVHPCDCKCQHNGPYDQDQHCQLAHKPLLL